MPTNFEETRKIPSEDKKDFFNYRGSKIELNDDNKKMTVSLRGGESSFNYMKERIKAMYEIASLDQITISFKTTLRVKKI